MIETTRTIKAEDRKVGLTAGEVRSLLEDVPDDATFVPTLSIKGKLIALKVEVRP